MALINCPECQHRVSTLAATCPQCGFPLVQRGAGTPEGSAAPLLVVRPSWWNYFWYLCFAWLLVPWWIAWLHRRSTILWVYSDRVAWERGLITKVTQEFFIKDIRALEVNQSFWGRLIGVGDLTISTAATVDAADLVVGIPQPTRVKDLIIAQRQRHPA